jgi:hypothetical protein
MWYGKLEKWEKKVMNIIQIYFILCTRNYLFDNVD